VRDSQFRIFDKRGSDSCLGTTGSFQGVPANRPTRRAYGRTDRAFAGLPARSPRRGWRMLPTAEYGGPATVSQLHNRNSGCHPVRALRAAADAKTDLGSHQSHLATLDCWRRMYSPMFAASSLDTRHHRSCAAEPCSVYAQDPCRMNRNKRRRDRLLVGGPVPLARLLSATQIGSPENRTTFRVDQRGYGVARRPSRTMRKVARQGFGERHRDKLSNRTAAWHGCGVARTSRHSDRSVGLFAFAETCLHRQSNKTDLLAPAAAQTRFHKTHTPSCDELYRKEGSLLDVPHAV
jgi:hypothetical protein